MSVFSALALDGLIDIQSWKFVTLVSSQNPDFKSETDYSFMCVFTDLRLESSGEYSPCFLLYILYMIYENILIEDLETHGAMFVPVILGSDTWQAASSVRPSLTAMLSWHNAESTLNVIVKNKSGTEGSDRVRANHETWQQI